RKPQTQIVARSKTLGFQCMILLRQHESDFEKEGILIHESLEYRINAAQDIQTIFSNRDARRGLQGDIAFGHLTICVAFKANGASLHLRPAIRKPR
ncbi:MAG: hypothetical protein WCB23_15930, partial [Pseudolabrys sp.]